MPLNAFSWVSSFASGVGAQFQKWFLASSTVPGRQYGSTAWGPDVFGSYDARRFRYEFFWSLFENTAYDDVHRWANQYLTQFGLYRYTRGCYNPAYRLGEFWAAHTMGGTLDPGAGDGRGVPSALPILTENPRLRPAIATLWRDSVWQVNKDVYCRLGAVLGDVGLKLDDDQDRERVTMRVVDPNTVVWADRDCYGTIQGYVIEELRLNPDYSKANPSTRVYATYTERATKTENGTVRYETLKDGAPYGWDGRDDTWETDYGFIPLVLHPHVKMAPDVPWGWSEMHGARVKIAELDDLASKLHDQIRKAVHPKWFFSGVANPATVSRAMRATARTPTTDDPQPGREDEDAYYAPSGATANPMVAPLDIQFTSTEIQNMLANLERDYPELLMDSSKVSGDASGKALIEARRKTEAKVHARRAGYDDALVRAMQMAVAIGGHRGYQGYEGFGLDSYQGGDLTMRIDSRPVFALDPADVTAQESAFWTAIELATRSGCPITTALRRNGWNDEQLQAFLADRDAEAARALDQATKMAAIAPPKAAAPAGA